MKLLLLSFFIIFASCKNSNTTTPSISTSLYHYWDQSLNQQFPQAYRVDGAGSKRLILCHTIEGNADEMDTGFFKEIKQGFIDAGYQVISINYPNVGPVTYADGGSRWRARWSEYIDWVVADTNSKYGTANENVIGGISFGGIQTVMAVADRPQYFDRYFTVVGITHINAHPLFAGMSIPDFDAFTVEPLIANTPGLIVFNNNDTVTNFQYTEQLVNELGSSVQSIENTDGDGHSVLQEQVDEVISWI